MLKMRSSTIRRKLMAIIMIPSVTILFVAIAAFVLWGQINSHEKIIQDALSHVAMLADNCKASLAFNNKEDAQQILSTLRFRKSVEFACVYDKEGKIFTQYKSENIGENIQAPKAQKNGYAFENGKFHAFKQIVLDDEVIGTVYLQDSMIYSRSELKWNTIVSLVILPIALVVGYFLSSNLQVMISRPILSLAQVAKEISEKKDYSVRALQESDDEIGYLTQVFNTMLGQIQNRDSELTNAKNQLEARVHERTSELTVANEELSREITERKTIELALRKSEERFRQVVESAGDWIWEVNTEGLYTYGSPIVEKILGYKLEEVVGKKHFYDFFAPDVREKLKKAAFEVFARRESFKRFVNANIHKNGSSVIFETSGTPIIDEKGNLCGYRGADRDITERKDAEAKLKAAQEELIETAHRAGMAEVAADVLHNVGNVLNSINVSTTLVAEKVANSELSNLDKLAGLINDHIKDLGTFLTEHPQGKHIPVYLTEVSKCLASEHTDILNRLRILTENVEHVKEIISTQQSYAKISGVEIRASMIKLVEDAIQINSAGLQRHGTQLIREFEELPDVEVNKQKALQILVNLISNAKYSVSNNGKEEKIITVRIYKHNEDYCRIEVADNGVGIPEENLTKIFNHGFTTKQKGHGFGLHSSALAAKEIGGKLTVHSDGEGQGATFTLEIPFKPVEV
jgi:PAS domain S-box-containing protein